ncbi:hypothetical protein EYY86_20475 [Hafnia paralvei]|uniref:ZirU family protein n=1 Tax=Hafnia paralvei TaxID=546367 RepID=UPI0010336ED2|nr:ZirU family protein [Hafnia paralvei]TBM09580.1 hypothetical protein EYY86_20475 [Hafnia paralvei]
MKFNYSLISAAIITATLSFPASASVRANDALSSATPASVGHRPVQAENAGKKLSVTGNLTTGSTLEITGIEFSDSENDTLSLDKMVSSSDKIKWYLVDSDTDTPSGAPAAEGKTFTIPGTASGKKIKVVYRIMTDDKSVPDAAFLPSTVLLTTSTSGVGGDNATNGTISSKLKSIAIKVNYTTTGSGQAPNDDVNGTAVAGTPVVGSTLEAELTCSADAAADCEIAKYDFTWQMKEDGASDDTYADISGQNTYQYTLIGTDQNKIFRVQATPKTTKNSDEPVQKTKRR